MTNTSLKTTVEWNIIPWRKLERRIFKLQKRIYQASSRGDTKAVRRLQKTLMRSWSAKTLAVRKVTQDNQGKKTAGVDGVKSLTPKQRLTLVSQLRFSKKVKPTRRVWIPKPGKDEKRPLGIPTMQDRATQALVKLALEPEWEARFEPNSYGFRPGRSAHDVVQAIFLNISKKPKWVLDADITKCFDNINHKVLLEKINTFPSLSRQIKAWLKAGVMDSLNYEPTDKGTPQGGVISPLLANIALHGMENILTENFPRMSCSMRETWFHQKGTQFSSPKLIRYADDFVILHSDRRVVERCAQIIDSWLNNIGLGLNLKKTRFSHTLETPNVNLSNELLGLRQKLNNEPGFDFLGFNIRQYPVGKHKSGKHNGKILGFKTLIKPSKESIDRHYHEIARVIKTHTSASQEATINQLNPIIRGWANYYSGVVSKEIFSKLDHLVFIKLKRWGKRRHPNKSRHWISNKYWHTQGNENWVFATKKEGKFALTLTNHTQIEIKRHIKVKDNASPFDGNLKYWSLRKGENKELPIRVTILLKKQKGKCAHCGLYFRENDIVEVDHIIPKSQGGKDRYDNLQLLHKHCHDVKTANDKKRYQQYESEFQIDDHFNNPW